MTEAELLKIACRYYANTDNWRQDDWNITSVISGPDYGNPGRIAYLALTGQEKLLLQALENEDEKE